MDARFALSAALVFAACQPLVAPSEECLQTSDCGPCDACVNGTCAADPTLATSAACTSTNPAGTNLLTGIWSGTVEADHPGWAGAPLDTMTVSFNNQHKLEFAGFSDFGWTATFGMAPDFLPLSGTAVAHVVPTGFLLEFSVEDATWNDASFVFRYRARTNDHTPLTPETDYTVTISGQVIANRMHVMYAIDGIQYTAGIHATADGWLIQNGAHPGGVPTELTGIFSGSVDTDHPNWSGPPIDRMTVKLDGAHQLEFWGIEGISMTGTYGMPPDEIPLSGTAIAHVRQGDGFLLEWTVENAMWSATEFDYQVHARSTPETQTPETDYVVHLSGRLDHGDLIVDFSLIGVMYTMDAVITAHGLLQHE